MLQGDALHGIIPWIDGLSFVGIVAGVVKGSDWLDSMLNDTGRAAITKWLKNVPPDAQDDSWPQALSGLIDRVFGEHPFSLKFILRSFIASTIAVGLVYFIFIRLHFPYDIDLELGNILWISLFISLIPDYFSLLTSRAVIELIPRNPRLWRIVILLVADAVITCVISVAGIAFGLISWRALLLIFDIIGFRSACRESPINFIFSISISEFSWSTPLSELNLASDSTSPFAIFIYSSFLTSVWLWLYVIGGVGIKVARRIHFLWVRVSKYLDIDKKPLGCIGKVSGLLLAGLWAVFISLEHALHYLEGR